MTIADVQAYWDRSPCNSRRSRAAVGSRLWAADVLANKLRVEPHILDFLRPEEWRERRVLDAGCGIGITTALLAQAGAQVTACDLSPESLGLAIKLCRHLAPAGDISWRCQDLERPWPLAYWGDFDLVFSYGVLHHTPRPDIALGHLRDVCRPRSELRLMLYHRPSTKAVGLALTHPVTLLRRGFDAAVAEQSEAQGGCPITRTHTRLSAGWLLVNAGFKVTRMAVAHIFPYEIDPYRRGEYVRRWYWRLLPQRAFAALERRWGWHLLIWAQAL